MNDTPAFTARRFDGAGGGKEMMQIKPPSPLPPITVKAGLRKCRLCGIRMPIEGISAVSQRDPSLCSECAGEGPAPTLPELLVMEQTGGTMPRPRKNTSEAATPEGWGAIEKDTGGPDRAHLGEYRAVIDQVCAEASPEWARILAPSSHKADRLRDLLKEEQGLEVQRKTLQNQHYVYFRLVAPSSNGNRP